jgi:putative hemolysin
MQRGYSYELRLAAGAMSLLLGACASAATQPEHGQNIKLPNPAVAKCIADGWRTEPVLSNGVPTGTVCVDPESGQRCEAWAYFRGECRAAGSATQRLNPPQ